MESKEKLIMGLQKSRSFIQETQNLHNQVIQLEANLKALEAQKTSKREAIESAKAQKAVAESGYLMQDYSGDFCSVLLYSVLTAIGVIVGLWILEIIVYLLTQNLYKYLFKILTNIILYIVIAGIAIIVPLIYSLANNAPTRKKHQMAIDHADRHLRALNEGYDTLVTTHYQTKKKLDELKSSLITKMQSEDSIFVQQLIPPDYFYPSAIDQFIYFIRNGHADNMKEAVKEYDEYMHRLTLEYNAELSRESAEKTAAYAKASAESASETARAMAISVQANVEKVKVAREIAEQQESIKFWTLYNGTLLEDIKNRSAH